MEVLIVMTRMKVHEYGVVATQLLILLEVPLNGRAILLDFS